MSKALFKYNGGNGALVCSGCKSIIKTGDKFTDEEWDASRGNAELPEQFCVRCQIVNILNDKGLEWKENRKSLLEGGIFRVITITPPTPVEIIDIIKENNLKCMGGLSPIEDSVMTIDIYIPSK